MRENGSDEITAFYTESNRLLLEIISSVSKLVDLEFPGLRNLLTQLRSHLIKWATVPVQWHSAALHNISACIRLLHETIQNFNELQKDLKTLKDVNNAELVAYSGQNTGRDVDRIGRNRVDAHHQTQSNEYQKGNELNSKGNKESYGNNGDVLEGIGKWLEGAKGKVDTMVDDLQKFFSTNDYNGKNNWFRVPGMNGNKLGAHASCNLCGKPMLLLGNEYQPAFAAPPRPRRQRRRRMKKQQI